MTKNHRFKEIVKSNSRDLCGVFVLSVISRVCVLHCDLRALRALGCHDKQPLYFQPRKMKCMAGFTWMTNKAMGENILLFLQTAYTHIRGLPRWNVCALKYVHVCASMLPREWGKGGCVSLWIWHSIMWMWENWVFQGDQSRHTRTHKDASL